MAKPNDTSMPTPPRTLEEAIEHERILLLQVRSMLHCLYEALLYADDDDSVMHAEVAQTAARDVTSDGPHQVKEAVPMYLAA